MRNVAVLIILTLVPSLAPGAQRRESLLQGDLRFEWPKSEKQLLEQPPREDAVKALFASFDRQDVVQTTVGEFRFVRLQREGPLSLVATTDYSSRGLFWSVMVVELVGERFRVAGLASAPPHDLSKEIVDLDGDGVYEILTKLPAGGYQGAGTRCKIAVYRIYKMKGDGSLVDASSQFKDYYERIIIPELDRVKAGIEATPAPQAGDVELDEKGRRILEEDLVRGKAEVQFVFDKYQRMLHGQKFAGLEKALSWTGSQDRELQKLAIQTLEEIDHPASVQALFRLQKTGDFAVSRAAEAALTRMKARISQEGAQR